MSSTEARQNFGEFLDRGSRTPVLVKRKNREVGVFVPVEKFRRMEVLKSEQLRLAVERISNEARTDGLTEDILSSILEEVNPS